MQGSDRRFSVRMDVIVPDQSTEELIAWLQQTLTSNKIVDTCYEVRILEVSKHMSETYTGAEMDAYEPTDEKGGREDDLVA